MRIQIESLIFDTASGQAAGIAADPAAVAALVAVAQLLAEEAAAEPEPAPRRSRWAAAGVLAAHGIPGGAPEPSWAAAERGARAARWSAGTTPGIAEW